MTNSEKNPPQGATPRLAVGIPNTGGLGGHPPSASTLIRLTICLSLATALFPLSSANSKEPNTKPEKITYATHVQPILREHCFACHNQDDATADLALDSFAGLTAGGAGGEVVAAGDPDGSRLWQLVTHQEEPKMPPGDKLPQPQLDVLRAWIEGGLLENEGSQPIKRKRPAIATIDPGKLGRPAGEPAMPEQLLHEPVLWSPQTGPVEALATSPWAPVAAVGWQRQLSFYHTDTHELLGIVPYVDGQPKVVRFSRDGSLVLVAGGRHGAAGSAALLDVKTGARVATLGDELDIVLAADISPDLSLVAIGGPKKRVKVYRVSDGELVYKITKHTEWITALGFSPDGKLLATGDRNGGALVWQATAGHERADLRGHKGAITSLDWRADAAMLATASEDGTVRLWNPAGKQIKSVTAHKPGVLSVRFAPDGHWVTTGRDQHVRSWKPDGAAQADLGKLPGMTLAATYTHDGKHVLASDYSGEVQLLDATSKKKLTSLTANPPPLATRLKTAAAALQQAQQKHQETQQQTKTLLAQLEAGKAAHETHERKLAEAQTSLAKKQKQFSAARELADARKQAADAADPPVKLAEEKLAAIRQQLDEALANAKQAEESPDADQADEKDPATDEPNNQHLAELEQQLATAQQQLANAKQQAEKATQASVAANDKRQTAEQAVAAAQTLLAQVANEKAGLPDLDILNEQHKKSTQALTAAQTRLQQAKQTHATTAEQQQRFQQASVRFADKLQNHQNEQQQLAEQSGKLSAEHKHAAEELSAHSEQLTAVNEQLQSLQAQLEKLQQGESKLRQQEAKLAEQLSAVQAKLGNSQRQVELLQQRERDFLAAEKLREKYASGE